MNENDNESKARVNVDGDAGCALLLMWGVMAFGGYLIWGMPGIGFVLLGVPPLFLLGTILVLRS